MLRISSAHSTLKARSRIFVLLLACFMTSCGNDISKIHGAVLSAWGFAGLVGNQVSLRVFARWGLIGVIAMLAGGYALNIVNVLTLRKR